jgi:ATP phosphoribosyltransferase regulatory subunit
VLALPRLAGDADVLTEAEAYCLNAPMMAALADLVAVSKQLAAYGVADAVGYDLAEVRDLDYYTGVTFEGFAPGIGFSLISGGRYDDLIAHFGPSFPAVGWALTLDRILLARELQGFKHEAPPAHVLLSANRCADCLAWASAARELGLTVVLDLEHAEPDALWEQAQATNTPRIILHREGKLLARDGHGEREFEAGDWTEVEAWLRS